MSEFDMVSVRGVGGGKRCSVEWAPWMGDWFVSFSPRNSNSHAEGPWDHWVSLAVSVLRHPLTKIVRPEAYAAAQGLEVVRFYDEVRRGLTDEELEANLGAGGAS